MTDRPVLELQNIGLQIGGAKILREVNMAVAPGEMIGVIGPNGAGKTTLFNVISGVLKSTSGTVSLSGDDVTKTPIHKRARVGLGRTFQTSSVFAGLSVIENVRMAAQSKLGGVASVLAFPMRGDAASEVARARLHEVGLLHHAETISGVLSHGDKRKLEIAMLLATEPSVILLDEPMAGVGSGDVPELVEVIRRTHQSGRTVLMVEHHIDVVLGLASRVAVMHHGELLALDTPEKIMKNPVVQQAYLGEAL